MKRIGNGWAVAAAVLLLAALLVGLMLYASRDSGRCVDSKCPPPSAGSSTGQN